MCQVRMTWPETRPVFEGAMKTRNILIAALGLALALPACDAQTAGGATVLEQFERADRHRTRRTHLVPRSRWMKWNASRWLENPEIHLAARKVAAAEAHVPLAGALDDPQAMYRGWQVPLTHP